MLLLAIVLFTCAILLGIFLITYVLRDINTPKAVAFIHGSLAALGIVLLLLYSFFYSPAPWLSLGVFVLAALGGFALIFLDLTGKKIPKWLALGHGLIAISGFLLLVMFVVS